MSDEITGPYVGPNPPPSGARFATGELLSGRYRVVAPLGKGGMGEVYRADDLALGQPVALKFLPPHLAADPDRLARFRKEVATARGVSHPNVCRVYDLGDHAGQLFLAMEYIDGEDLASLLRRVGRLPEEKGVEIARQLCLALAAVHEQSLLHRDLKPQNVMLDGRGKVRLTDFGLAAAAEDISGAEVRSGTPAYQAPEQLRGETVSVQSDLFSLGLVLYEVFTGKRAFPATTRDELARAYEQTTPSKPSSQVTGLNPAVERALLRCLELEAKDRPRSAYEVLAGLPGGDPLTAALAAGETPSPQMVADAPVEGRLSPAVGLALLAAVVGGIVLIAVLADRTMLFRQVTLNRAPEVMAQQAQDLLERFCHTDPPADQAWHYRYDDGYLRHVRDTDPSADRWEGLKAEQPSAVMFVYRQSPRPLLAYPLPALRQELAYITPLNPPPVVPGMAGVELDGRGRLLALYVVPPEHVTGEPDPTPDWAQLFTAAGLDLAEFRPAHPEWTWLMDADSRVAWTGTYPGRPELPLRVEAGAWRGKPVLFKMIAPAWAQPERSPAAFPGLFWFFLLLLTLTVVGVGLAARNLWLGRGDWRGAARLALVYLLVQIVAWAAEGGHSFSLDGLDTFAAWLGRWSFFAAIFGAWYLALEPTVRRRWPWRIVAWGRLLDGRLRDPLVGRDLLLGLAAGTLISVLPRVVLITASWFGPPPVPLTIVGGLAPFGPPVAWGVVVMFAGFSISVAMLEFTGAFLLNLVLRKPWLAWGVFFLLTAAGSMAGELSPSAAGWALLRALVLAVMVGRFGLLATMSMWLAFFVLGWVPLTTDLSAWYARQGLVAALVLIGLALYGFVVSVGAKRLALRGFFGDE
jgi:serine/threonine-protein kinase